MKRILFLTPYPKDVAPSQRLKFEQYYNAFEEAGFQLQRSAFVSESFWQIIYKRGRFVRKFLFTTRGYLRRVRDLFRLRRFDIVYIHLWVTPFGPPVFEWIACILAKKVVFDIDDMTFLGHASKANRFLQWLKGSSKPIYLMKKADHVITCTPKLDAVARQFNPNTTDISSTINTETYKARVDYSIGEMVTLGWSGSHSTSPYLHLLDRVFQELKTDGLKFNLLVIGDATFTLPGIDVEAIPWNLDTEVQDLARIDIGLYPLPDEEWVYGKSGLKALQYMALGIPTIATAIGANFRIITDGENGFLVKPGNHDGWKQRILQLANDMPLREKTGTLARRTVEEHYSVNANVQHYLKVLKTVSPAGSSS